MQQSLLVYAELSAAMLADQTLYGAEGASAVKASMHVSAWHAPNCAELLPGGTRQKYVSTAVEMAHSFMDRLSAAWCLVQEVLSWLLCLRGALWMHVVGSHGNSISVI